MPDSRLDELRTGDERLLRTAEAARVLGTHPQTLRGWAKNGWSGAVRVGQSWRFRRDAIFAPDGTVRSQIGPDE